MNTLLTSFAKCSSMAYISDAIADYRPNPIDISRLSLFFPTMPLHLYILSQMLLILNRSCKDYRPAVQRAPASL